MRQFKLFIVCWVATYAMLWTLIGEAAIVAVTFFATAIYVPVSVVDFLRRRKRLRLIGHYAACWAFWLIMYGLDPATAWNARYFLTTFLLAGPLLLSWHLFKRGAPAQSGLDQVLLRWSPHDPFTMRNLLDGGLCILGRPGSGKTSASGKLLALCILAFPMSGGLILSSSPTDLAMWRGWAAMVGRPDDLVVFGPDHSHRFHMIAFLARMGADQKELAKAILTIGESRDNDESAGGKGEEIFWTQQAKSKLETAIAILTMAGEDISIPNIHRFILTAAQSPGDLADEQWRDKYHNQCFAKAWKAKGTDIQKHDYQLAADTWLTQWPVMAEKTRSSVEASIGGTLHVFNSGQVRELLSTATTVTPEVMGRGKWVFVDMSVGQHGSSGAFVLNAWKYATQKYVTRRNPGHWTHPIAIWADEAGKIVNSNDAFYLTESRKFGGATIFLAQSMQSFHAALPSDRGKSQAEVLLGCFSTKVLHAIGDPGTAEWASNLLGKEVKIHYSTNTSGDERSTGSEIMGKAGMSFGSSEHVEAVLEPKAFMHGLRTGGRNNGYMADAIIIRTGEPFSNGHSWMCRAFSQR